MVKSPKLYFLDAGLAAWLGGWREVESVRLGPMAGPLFETHVFGEILRRFRHRVREVDISFWRTRDGQEVDFLVATGGLTFPIEVKIGLPEPRDLPGLHKIRGHDWQTGTVISLASGETTASLTDEWSVAPAGDLSFLPV
jgi:hypothetical protein